MTNTRTARITIRNFLVEISASPLIHDSDTLESPSISARLMTPDGSKVVDDDLTCRGSFKPEGGWTRAEMTKLGKDIADEALVLTGAPVSPTEFNAAAVDAIMAIAFVLCRTTVS